MNLEKSKARSIIFLNRDFITLNDNTSRMDKTPRRLRGRPKIGEALQLSGEHPKITEFFAPPREVSSSERSSASKRSLEIETEASPLEFGNLEPAKKILRASGESPATLSFVDECTFEENETSGNLVTEGNLMRASAGGGGGGGGGGGRAGGIEYFGNFHVHCPSPARTQSSKQRQDVNGWD